MVRKNSLTAIIVIMGVVLAGLVAIQIYWINNAIKLREQQFRQNVTLALNYAARRMEQKDAMAMMTQGALYSSDPASQKKAKAFLNDPTCIPGYDKNKVDESVSRMVHEGVIDTNKLRGDILLPNMSIHIDTTFNRDSMGGTVYTSTIMVQMEDSVHRIDISHTNRDKLDQEVNKKIQKMAYRKSMIDDIFFQFFSDVRQHEEPVDTGALVTFITAELANRNINIPFEYQVSNGLGVVVAKSKGFDTSDIKDSHKVTLFSNDLFSDPNHLYVHFPNQWNYVRRSLSIMSLSSMILILLISMCFAYTVFVIYRQKKLSDMKTDFINNMTHELKTPVATISLASEMIRNERIAEDKDKVVRFANVIYDENKRLGGQVEKVLQMAALEKGEFKLKLTAVNLHDIIHQECEKLALLMEDRRGQFHLQLNATQPVINADGMHFTHIFSNLLDNAIKYSTECPDITIETKDATNGIVFAVTDKGIGMNREQQKWVFERFYRVPTGNIHNVKGFGLGLSYVKLIVDAHKGSVKLKSELNKGSTFEIYMPYSPPS